jgi:hypothetical protein
MDISYHSLSEVPVRELVAICHIDITTARRWRRGSNLPPPYVLDFVNAKRTGDLGFLDPAWRGWTLRDGHLISPEDWRISMSDVLASRLHEAQLAAWRLEVRKLRAELANAELHRLEEQPQVEDWAIPQNWAITG